MQKGTAHILLGSNQGNRSENLARAIRAIEGECGTIIAMSSVYRTAAWGKLDQPDFFNQVVVISTGLQPHELLKSLLDIENRFGRERHEKWGPRVIDLDIQFCDNLVMKSPDLIIPHPELGNRKFALVPLNEVAGDFRHPILQITVSEMLDKCVDKLKVERVTDA